jgi:hypothetical protein
MTDSNSSSALADATDGAVDANDALDVPVSEADGAKRWVIVAGGTIPSGLSKSVAVIVCEHWDDPVLAEKGEALLADENVDSVLKVSGYPTKGDLYFRTDPSVEFNPANPAAPILTLGDNVMQTGTWGFDKRTGGVHVGPAHPAFAAANIAVQRGATEIEIVGLTKRQASLLAPFFDKLPEHPRERYQSDVKITVS